MVNIDLLREDPEKFKKANSSKNKDPKLIDEVLELDQTRRQLQTQLQELQTKRNIAAKEKNIEKGKQNLFI